MKHRSYKVYHTLMKLNSPFHDCITLPNRGMPVGITSIIGFDLYFSTNLKFLFRKYKAKGRWFVIRRVNGTVKYNNEFESSEFYDMLWECKSMWQAFKLRKYLERAYVDVTDTSELKTSGANHVKTR